jgi:hypothetical protein
LGPIESWILRLVRDTTSTYFLKRWAPARWVVHGDRGWTPPLQHAQEFSIALGYITVILVVLMSLHIWRQLHNDGHRRDCDPPRTNLTLHRSSPYFSQVVRQDYRV